jgi:hypothetical protein
MGTLRKLFKPKGSAVSLMAGLMLVGLLGACNTVTVIVDSCPPGNMRSTIGDPFDGPGGCNPGVPHTGLIPSGTICKNTGGTIITCPAGATCISGSTKCPSPPGTCPGTRKSCKTNWTESTPGSTSGTCLCGPSC